MIILVSKSDGEQSTDEVIDWLFFKNQEHTRINGSDFLEGCFSVTLAKGFKKYNIHNNRNIENLFNVKRNRGSLWFRRWYDGTVNLSKKNLFNFGSKKKDAIDTSVILNDHMKNERRVISDWILCHLQKNNRSLNRCGFKQINKLDILEQAAGLGLDIPETIVTNSKSELIRFFKTHKRIVTKAMSDGIAINVKGGTGNAMMYTEEVTLDFINKLSQQFGVSLFQSLLEKEFELRIFYLNCKFYAMAIFSQSNTKTMIDFRRYDYNKFNRWVPFILPKKVEKKLEKLLCYVPHWSRVE